MSELPAVSRSGASAKCDAASGVNRAGGTPSLVPPTALNYLGKPPLVKGEKQEDFYQFRMELARDLRPRSFSEWVIVDDLAKLKSDCENRKRVFLIEP